VTDTASARSAAAAVVALAALVFVAAWIARVSEGRRAIQGSDAAFARGDRVEAIVLARAAAEARCPSCSAPQTGCLRLERIAKDAEARGDDANAVAAWRAIRSATLASVVLDTSAAQRERADAEIARLEHRIDAAAAALGGAPSPAASEERLRASLTASTIPSAAVFALLSIGGAAFLLGATRFARRRTFQLSDLALALVGGAVAAAGVLLF
jgi:hypothetical protein